MTDAWEAKRCQRAWEAKRCQRGYVPREDGRVGSATWWRAYLSLGDWRNSATLTEIFMYYDTYREVEGKGWHIKTSRRFYTRDGALGHGLQRDDTKSGSLEVI